MAIVKLAKISLQRTGDVAAVVRSNAEIFWARQRATSIYGKL